MTFYYVLKTDHSTSLARVTSYTSHNERFNTFVDFKSKSLIHQYYAQVTHLASTKLCSLYSGMRRESGPYILKTVSHGELIH